ncbi:MAG: TonB family protein [Candidatus Obscuribacterales bacterium]|nr:TonB family protein [Candidatus Obscuribacterales bacterium]
MKTESLEERKIEDESPQLSADLSTLQGLEPKRALTLSLLPGLGQIYNGEPAKGLLFMAATVANLLILGLLFFTEPFLNLLIQTAALFHTESKINVQQALEIIHTGRSVTLVYLTLILSFVAYVARDAYDRAVEKRRGLALPKFKLSMPEATSGSYLLHFSIICALVLAVIFVVAPVKEQEQATEIELVKEDPPPEPKKEPEAPKPKQEAKQEPKKAPAPKLNPPTPPKPTPVAFAVKSEKAADPVVVSTEPAPDPGPPVSATGSPDGVPGGTGAPENGGGNGGDGDDVDFGSYLAEVQKRIKKNWFPPRGAESLSVTLKFKVMKDGHVASIRLVKSSGIAAADDAAKAAINNASPFPNLPKGAGDDVDIKFTFDYNVFNGKLNQ